MNAIILKTLDILKNFTVVKDAIYNAKTIEEFGNTLSDLICNLPEKDSLYVLDIYQIETFQLDIRRKNKGTLCFQTRLMLLKKELTEFQEYDETEFRKKRFVRNPFIEVYESRWNWKENNNQDSLAGKYNNVFYSTDQEIYHLLQEPFSATILQLLEKPLSIEELAAYFLYLVVEKEMMEEKLSEQIVELLKSFFIRIVD